MPPHHTSSFEDMSSLFPTEPRSAPKATENMRTRIVTFCASPAIAALQYFWDLAQEILFLFSKGVRLLRTPLALLTTLYILLAVLVQAGTVLLQQTSGIVSLSRFLVGINVPRPDFCRVPVVSFFLSCPRYPHDDRYSHLVTNQAAGFAMLRNNAAEGTIIAIDIHKLGVVALPTLINLINASDLNAREALVDALNDLGEQAIHTSQDLQQYSAAVEDGLATVIGTNKVFMRRLEIEAKVTTWSWLWSWSLTTTTSTAVFHQALSYFEDVVDRLNMASSVCNQSLGTLRALLNAVEAIVREEHSLESSDRERLLAELWTLVGGNRRRLAHHNEHIAYLETALNFEAAAKEQVADATFILRGMANSVLGLKRRFSVAIDPTNVEAVELHYMVLAEGIQRLMEIQAHGKEADRSTYTKVWLA